jgi:uncharacterized membrane protein YphA (DoxX/SURF4 family)
MALWIVQGLLCAVFLLSGLMKLFDFEGYKAMIEKKSPAHGLGMSRGLVTFIGISEVAGSLGLILPGVTGIAPALTPLAALGLAIIMILATLYHLRRKESPLPTIVLLLLAGFVAVGRL